MLLIQMEFTAHFPKTGERPVQNPAILNPMPTTTMPLEFHQLDQCWEHLRVRHTGQQRQLIASLAETGQQTPIVVVEPTEENARYVVIDGHKRIAALRQLGRSGVAQLIDRCCEYARLLVTGIGALPAVEVLWEPVINQALVRFLDPSPLAAEQDHDRCTDRVIQRIVAQGGAFFAGTTWRGKRAMRISVLNWQTAESDVDRTIESVARALGD